MYDVFLDKVLLPVTPAKIQCKIKNQNKTITLINEGEVNILKQAGLSEFTFSALLPQTPYPFARYTNGFQEAAFFLDAIKKLKAGLDVNGNLKPFQFIVSRTAPNGAVFFKTDTTVTIEDYTIKEDAKSNGLDVMVDIKLKQYWDRATKTLQLTAQASNTQTPLRATVEQARPAGTAPQTKSYTVASGDSLWSIAKKYYNDGSQYTRIFEANRDQLSSPNQIYPNQVLRMP